MFVVEKVESRAAGESIRRILPDQATVQACQAAGYGFRHRLITPDHTLSRKLARRFRDDSAEDYFRFLTEPNVEPTNNGTKRQIRPVVIDRRITQGTRSQAGMRWCERIWMTIATCKKQTKMYLSLFINRLLLIGAIKTIHR